jgi:hypothetical protein
VADVGEKRNAYSSFMPKSEEVVPEGRIILKRT